MYPQQLPQTHVSQAYNIKTDKLHSEYGHLLPSAIQDLIAITSEVMSEDRRVRRPRHERRGHEELRGWVRTLSPRIAVRDPALWTRSDVYAIVHELLAWLSEDHWMLSYEALPAPAAEQTPLFTNTPTNDVVVLYSGGLDSLAGTLNLLQTYQDRSVVLMSGLNDSLKRLVESQICILKRHYGARVRDSSITFELRGSDPRREEETQRTRAFRFLAYGAAEALAYGATEVVICENGVGALNLPLNLRQLGAQHTRATHPKTLRLMTKLMAAIGFPQIRLTLPYLFWTKGELCRALKGGALERLSLLTVSCDSFPLRVKPPKQGSVVHCGTCTSCLLRRESLFAAGIHSKHEDQRYRRDVFSAPKSTERSELEPLLMMLDQVTLIETAMAASDPNNALLAQFPDLTIAIRAVEEAPEAFGLLDRADVIDALCDLLKRYALEWREFRRHVVLA